MAPGPSSCHGVSHQPFLSRPFLSVGLPVSSSTTGHPPSERHVQAERKRQEQDWEQTALFRLCHHQTTLISSRFSGRFCHLPGHLCPCFLLGKWNIHFIGRLSVSVSMALQRCWKPYNCNGVELFLKEYSDFDGNTGSHCLEMNYYVNFLGGIGSNRLYIKWIFGTQDNWKN